ncbi:MAG: hypothetical protein A2268_05215 [Candidatus Raymondbacteria bacterium RifOxyA12_full_50_37]|nr:MAG: hypothetical protein A2268_05215 [Candidatus Raymondbacteria bacterium RifOxyA12_full_50_37]OGJ88967.1 MAG: hypothetical protein A2248_02450 [Candidatus Raymondbacteria bacterium RIFOXYA2_FULL_49_16]OGJ96995.1 MAG: hypothetical protein A2453_03870 [Candidatus Raymondbacteria bacterium RIFOXYC2_FULL_50_21]OGK02540.1 MAG: hypothetical protein A2487_14935 [Candidatus Raymondbacteria bacterium RifOxyC12_full_50_8]OGP42067.1 MAG: hypothetical protein A2324_18070 [Candidatus Raymondbacteria b
MAARIALVLVNFLISVLCAEDHVFWYKALTNSYDITYSDSNGHGPGLPVGAQIHQGKIVTCNNSTGLGYAGSALSCGSDINDDQGWCCAFFSGDLQTSPVRNVTSAKIRAELSDWVSGNGPVCNGGPIAIRVGVADVSFGIMMWGSADAMPDDAVWADLDPMNTLNYSLMLSGAEETIQFTAPAGRLSNDVPSLLDGHFIEIDVTDQINWILDNQSSGSAWAIVLLSQVGVGSTGKFTTLSAENGFCMDPGSAGITIPNDPWSTDCNTVHLFMTTSPLIPSITSVVPDSGALSGGYTASIYGSAFSSGMQVFFGALPSPSVTYYSNTRLIVVVPPSSSDGPVNITVIIDTLRDTLSNGFRYYVNFPPIITTVLGQADTIISDSVPYTLDINATDPNHDILTYSLALKPSTMAINAATGIISWSPIISDSGRKAIRAIVSDNHGMYDTLDFAVHVTPWNYYPIFVSQPETTTLEDSVYRYIARATDPDSDTVAYTIITGPGGMVLSGDTLRWTPVDANIGVHPVSVRATDGKGGFAVQTFSLRVIGTPDPPVFQSFVPSGDTSLAEGDTLTFRARAVDPDNAEAVGFFWFLNNGYMSNESTYTLRPDFNAAGLCSVRVMAFDGNGTVDHSWYITVVNRSAPPVLIAPARNGSATGDSTVAWNASADPDLDTGSTMYRVEFSATSNFSLVLALKDSLIGRSYRMNELVPAGALPEASVIFVRVMAFDASGYATGYNPATPFIFLYFMNTEKGIAVPYKFALDQNSPNPFNPRTCIRFAVPAMDKGAATMHMTVYDIKGSVIRSLVQGVVSPGYHTVVWDSRDDNGAVCQNGVYVLKMACGSFTKCIKMALLK